MKTKQANILKSVGIAIIISMLVGLATITKDMVVTTVRNGEEYCDALNDGQAFEQGIMLNYASNFTVGILPIYQDPSPDMGISYVFTTEEKEDAGFIPLRDCLNKNWTVLAFDTNVFYKGTATLRLEAVGLNAENSMQFLIATNTLQPDPELLLEKDGVIIPNGRICTTYYKWDFNVLTTPMLITFILSLAFCLLYKKIFERFRKYPMVYLTGILFVGFLLIKYPQLLVVNPHVSAQYFQSWMDLGLVRRALAGTLIDVFHINFDVKAYVLYGIFSIMLMLALELVILYDKRNLSDRNPMHKLFILFLCMPLTFPTFFEGAFFARFDQLLIAVVLLCMIVIIKEKGLWLIPVLCVLAILLHEMYLAMFVPFVFCLLLYKWYLTKEKRYFYCLLATSVLSLGVGVYVSFIAKAAIPFETAWANIQATGDPALVWYFPLQIAYYSDFEGLMRLNHADTTRGLGFPTLVYSMIFLIPILILLVQWFVAFIRLQKDKLGRYIVMFFPFTLAGIIFSMYTMCDWGRLLVMYSVALFFSFLTVWSMDGQRASQAASIVWKRATAIGGRYFFPVLCVLYLIATIYGAGAGVTSLFGFIPPLIVR